MAVARISFSQKLARHQKRCRSDKDTNGIESQVQEFKRSTSGVDEHDSRLSDSESDEPDSDDEGVPPIDFRRWMVIPTTRRMNRELLLKLGEVYSCEIEFLDKTVNNVEMEQEEIDWELDGERKPSFTDVALCKLAKE